MAYVDTQLALKANQSTTYTKTEVDTALTLEANQATTYTKKGRCSTSPEG